ncbi:MAG: hypothetical protein ABTQ29_02945 [Siculibacillus sp.]
MTRVALRIVLALAGPALLAACGGSSTVVEVEMSTRKVDRAAVDRALDEFRNVCRPLFTRHRDAVKSIRAVVSDEGSTQVRRFGWGVHVEIVAAVRASAATLPQPVEAQARFLFGGGGRPGVLAFSPTAAALCDQTPAPGRRTVFLPAPALAEHLPRLALTPTSEQVAAYRAEEARAMTGDYQSQRNMAWCYVDGCYGVEEIDDVKACAWRKVILASSHPKVDGTDRDNVATDCDAALSPPDLADATQRARELFAKIYKRDMP